MRPTPILAGVLGPQSNTWKRLAAAVSVLWLLAAGVGTYLTSQPAAAAGAGAGDHVRAAARNADDGDDADDDEGDGDGDKRSPEDRIAEGQQIFRFDTFGDEQKWTD